MLEVLSLCWNVHTQGVFYETPFYVFWNASHIANQSNQIMLGENILTIVYRKRQQDLNLKYGHEEVEGYNDPNIQFVKRRNYSEKGLENAAMENAS